jgi:hypothetical protein
MARGCDAGMRFNEFEIGTTERSQIGRCAADWAHRSGDNSKFSYDDGSLGLIYHLSNPAVDLDTAAAEAFFL